MANNKPSPCVENSANPNNSGQLLDLPAYEGSGTTVNDVSGSGNNCTLSSSGLWSTGLSGPCLIFSGSTNYGTGSDADLPSGNSAWSIYGSFYTNVTNEGPSIERFILAWGTAAIVNHRASACIFQGNFGIDPFGNRVLGSVNIQINTWYRFVMTYDGTYISTYLNGVQDINQVAPGSGAMNIIIGGTYSIGSPFDNLGNSLYTWDGLLDGIGIKSGVMTVAQIAQDYADAFARFRAISPIQSTPLGHSTVSTTATCAFGTTPTTGGAFEVSVWGLLSSATIAAPTVMDNQTGNTYLPAVFKDDTLLHGEFAGIYYLPSTVAIVGTCSITVTTAVTCLALEIQATELNPGNLTLDQSSSSVGTGTTPVPGAVTTTASNEILFTVCSANDTVGTTVAPPSGFYLSGVELSSGLYQTGGTAYQSVSSIQTATNPAFSLNTSSVWTDVIATFKVSSPPPPPAADVFPDWLLKKLYYEEQEEIIYQ